MLTTLYDEIFFVFNLNYLTAIGVDEHCDFLFNLFFFYVQNISLLSFHLYKLGLTSGEFLQMCSMLIHKICAICLCKIASLSQLIPPAK